MPAKLFSHARIAKQIIRQIERNGYIVKAFYVDETVEMHAISLQRDALCIARCNDGVGPTGKYRAALLIAEALGIKF